MFHLFQNLDSSTRTLSQALPQVSLLTPVVNPQIDDPQTDERTELDDSETNDTGFRVILYDDDYHSMDEVVMQIQKATGYDELRAIQIMLEAHRSGRAICFRGGRSECHRVAGILRQIRLQVEVDCD